MLELAAHIAGDRPAVPRPDLAWIESGELAEALASLRPGGREGGVGDVRAAVGHEHRVGVERVDRVAHQREPVLLAPQADQSRRMPG